MMIYMSCFSPNYLMKYVFHLPGDYLEYKKGYSSRVFKVSKDKTFAYRFIKGDTVKNEYNYKNGLVDFKNHLADGFEVSPIPCGRCLGCRLDYAKQWSARCFVESLQYEHNYFLTLTYNDANVKHNVGNSNKSLSIEDFEKFIKDLRNFFYQKYNITGIRYFGVGEYGSTTLRPHYHLILFNCPIFDLSPVFDYIDENGVHQITTKVKCGNIYYDSPMIKKIWSKGNVVIGKCEVSSCAYVARYCTKKLYGDDAIVYKSLGIIPPFIRMSRKPGIGSTFLTDNIDDIYLHNGYVICKNGMSSYVKPGRFCDRLLEKLNKIKYDNIKDVRKSKMLDAVITKINNSNMSYYDQLEAESENFSKKIKSLKRIL